MMRQDEYQQMMEEREQMLEEAFERAYKGFATEVDWALLLQECGLRPDAKGTTC